MAPESACCCSGMCVGSRRHCSSEPLAWSQPQHSVSAPCAPRSRHHRGHRVSATISTDFELLRYTACNPPSLEQTFLSQTDLWTAPVFPLFADRCLGSAMPMSASMEPEAERFRERAPRREGSPRSSAAVGLVRPRRRAAQCVTSAGRRGGRRRRRSGCPRGSIGRKRAKWARCFWSS
jgi:hypothetical protein